MLFRSVVQRDGGSGENWRCGAMPEAKSDEEEGLRAGTSRGPSHPSHAPLACLRSASSSVATSPKRSARVIQKHKEQELRVDVDLIYTRKKERLLEKAKGSATSPASPARNAPSLPTHSGTLLPFFLPRNPSPPLLLLRHQHQLMLKVVVHLQREHNHPVLLHPPRTHLL